MRPPRGPLALLMVTALIVSEAAGRDAAWIKLDAGKFTIVSEVSEKETRRWATEFEQFHRGLDRILTINEAALQPVTVVLFKSQGSMKRYKPLEKGKPADVAGYFSRSSLGNFIETAVDSEDEQTRHLIYHEGVHWLTNVNNVWLPLWIDEGLAEVFSTFTTDDGSYSYGAPLPWHVLLLEREGMIPLRQLLGTANGSLLYNEGNRTSIFYAESWLFVHYLLFSNRMEHAGKFGQLVRDLRSGEDPDTVFLKLFGMNCAGMDRRLKDYAERGSYSILHLAFDRGAVEQGFSVHPASPAEVDLAKGCLLCAVNRPDDSVALLERVSAALPHNPVVWEALGCAAYAQRNYDDTASSFEHAAAEGSRNFFVYSFLGDVALGVDPSTLVASVGGNVPKANAYYMKEPALNPRDQHAYDNMAGNCYALDAFEPAFVHMLGQGALLYPDDTLIQFGLAVVFLKQGRTDIALRGLERIAGDTRPANKAAASLARTLLDDQRRQQATDTLNRNLQNGDFDAALAGIDALLASPMDPTNRQNLETLRGRTLVESKLKRAWALAGDGHPDQAKVLLEEVLPQVDDPRRREQIQSVLAGIDHRAPQGP